jgi:hypothetical protein
MTNPRWLGALGHINGLNWDFTYPGGCNTSSLTIGKPPTWRPDALNPGRIYEVWVGASRIWEGILDESVPDTTGWSVTAHGAGTYGSSFMADYGTWNFDDPINRAIARTPGLRWRKPTTMGNISAAITVADNDSISITDFLNNATIQAGLLWNIDTHQGNLLQVAAPPNASTPDRLLVCTVPNPRTLAAGLNTLYYKYVSAVASGTNQETYTYGKVINQAAANLHGNLEQQVDMTSAGLMSGTVASGNAQNILNQYMRANFASTYQVRQGQYLTIGGSKIDLKTETAYPHVARLLLTDGSYGGEVIALPVSFVVGQYAYDQDSDSAGVTPYQSYKSDLSTLLTALVPKLRQ